jgi:hypothetical protein
MIINLLSNPRNVSTALMYSFAQRQDTSVLDEPFYAAYLDRSGEDHPARSQVLAVQNKDYDAIVQKIRTFSEKEHLFVKNMAHHLRGQNPSWLLEGKNILFIRDPGEVLDSFSKVIAHPTIEDIAILDQVELWSFLKENQGHAVVLDARDLLLAPREMLILLCGDLEIPFDPGMLHWSRGPKPYDGVWAPYWYGRVHESSGFAPYEKKEINLSNELRAVEDKARKAYDILHKERLQL